MATLLMVYMHAVLAIAGGMQDSEKWISKDIGQVGASGTATYNEEAMIWTVRGSGSDISATADSFQYLYRPLVGDGIIVAKVESIGQTDAWAKCGVMIRESMDPGSRFAAVYATPGNGVRFQARVNTTGAVTHDTSTATKEQKALKAPVWIKLERKGNQFCGYYATDKAGTSWTLIAWKPQAIAMPKIVHVGLAVCSHATGVLCEAWFSNAAVSAIGDETTDLEILAHPREALAKAYQNLEQLGNWRGDSEAVEKHGNLIARSLLTIARVRDISGEPASAVLPDYYRITEFLPDSQFSIDALARIAVLGGEEGGEYAVKRLDTRSKDDRDRFYAIVMKGYGDTPESQGREAVVKSFIEYVGKSSSYALLEQVIADLGDDEQAMSVCKSLIRHGMAQPSDAQVAIAGLRYMALKPDTGQGDMAIQEMARWVATEFKDTKLAACATGILADTYYERGSYAEAVEVFQAGLFLENQPESKIVESIESILASYQANTLQKKGIDLERIYKALGEKAGGSKLHAVALHCQRKVAELKGLSLETFTRSAQKGVKYCESSPANEVWFWKGLIAAGEEDLGTAVAAYERFVQGDDKSVLAARAYYDIARTKMAIGEDAKEWIVKAKALSPCDAVIQLERRLSTRASSQR